AERDDRSIESLVIRGRVDDSLGELAGLESLTQLGIEGGSLDELASLAALPQLRELAVRRCEGELRGLAGLRRLEVLELSAHARVGELGPRALAPLAGLGSLRELDLGDGGWFDIDPLTGLRGLERL